VPNVEYNIKHKSNSHLHRVTFTFKHVPSWYTGLHPSIQKVGFISASIANCLQSTLFISGPKRWKPQPTTLAMWESWSTTYQLKCCNKLWVRLAEWSPMFSILLDPLQNTWLASDFHQTLTRSKMSSPGYRHLAPISCTIIAEQTLVQCCDKCLNNIVDYVQIWCVPPTTHVPCIHLGQNKVLGISVRYLVFLKLPCMKINVPCHFPQRLWSV